MPLVPAAIGAAIVVGAAARRAARQRALRAAAIPAELAGAAAALRATARAVIESPTDDVVNRYTGLMCARDELGSTALDAVQADDAATDRIVRAVGAVRTLVDEANGRLANAIPNTPTPPLVGEVLVLGMTGTGKSTLVNAMVEAPVAAARAGAPLTIGAQRYRTAERLGRLIDTRGLESAAGTTSPSGELTVLASLVDVVWYCVHAELGRFQPGERAVVRNLADARPVIVALTQALDPAASLRRAIQREVPPVPIIAVLAAPRCIRSRSFAQHGVK